MARAERKPAGRPGREPEGGFGNSPTGLSGGVARGSRDLDRLIHERVRLGIMSALAVGEALTFSDLRRLLDTSDGNLSVHARRLEEGGYIECRKYFEGRSPRTEYRLTPTGRAALEAYLRHMEALIAAVREK